MDKGTLRNKSKGSQKSRDDKSVNSSQSQTIETLNEKYLDFTKDMREEEFSLKK